MFELREPLSQVVFVEDYFQLAFQEQRLSVFGRAVFSEAGAKIQLGEPGFCDAVVQLIGQQVKVMPESAPFILALAFQGGARLQIPSEPAGPEAYSLHDGTGRIVVGRDA